MADASAAACSSSMAGYASTSDSQYHDVFINHRGPDVKETFATPLYRSLTAKGLQVFLDKLEMQVGQYILSQIEAAIRVASVHIAIFSPRYAESEWCLNELLWMVKTGKTILPVFYNVKPEHLRRTKWTGTEKDGPYAIALRKYEQEQRHGTETIQRWREALKDVANISGLELEAFNGDQNKLLDKLVQIVLQKFPKPLEVKYSTGLKEKLEELERTVLSQLQGGRREGAKVVGIVGLGGVGKSTLAKYFFNCNTSNYKGSSFLSDVRENAARNNISSLQSQLIKDLKHPASDIKIESCEEGADKLKNNLSSCHALVILDDVDHVNQLDAFLPIKDVLNSNSLILVTTRDESVLTRSGILKSSIYHLTGLNRQYSQQLFCSHAFSQRAPLPGFEILVDRFLKECEGLPLFLKMSGALLCGKNDIENDIDYWKECLDGVNKLPAYIENRLTRISYDSLDEEEKQIFLDIACFFIGEDRDKWIRIWGGSGWSGLGGFRNLESKCLVEVDSENRIRMHDHLRDMGRKIAYSSESMERRLWHPLNNLQEIQSSTEITQVQGCSSLTMSSETLGNMSKLKCLDLSCCFDKELLPPESEESNDEEEFEELMELYHIEESEEGYNGEGSEEDVESEGEESEEGYNAEEIEEAMEVDHGHEYEELTEVNYEGFIFSLDDRATLSSPLRSKLSSMGVQSLSQAVSLAGSPSSMDYWLHSRDINLDGLMAREWDTFITALRSTGIILNRGMDIILWAGGDGSGSISVKNVFTALQLTKGSTEIPPWITSIWKWRIPLKIQLFFWLCIQDKLLTWEVLRRRGWHGPSLCALCKTAIEDSTHLFLQCAFTANIWSHLCILFSLPAVWIGDSFISCLVSWLSIAAAPHPLVALVCWQTWKERNRVIFEGRSSSPKAVLLRILSSFHFQQTSPKTILYKALDYRLDEGATLACFDGAALSSGLCFGAGGTFKTHSSRITKWFINCGAGTNIKAELLGLWATLYLASHWSLNHLHILGDSSVIVNWINHNSNLRSILI